MNKRRFITMGLLAVMAVMSSGPPLASALTLEQCQTKMADHTIASRAEVLECSRLTGVPDYNTTPNWANSPPMRKFVDELPGLCGPYPTAYDADGKVTATLDVDNANLLGQCLSIAKPDTDTFPGSDYYVIELTQFREKMHSDLYPATGDGMDGTLLRGYRQVNTTGPANVPHSLGPIIIAHKDRPVRILFKNSLPTDEGGKLFIPVDLSVMGSGPGPTADRSLDFTDPEICEQTPSVCFAQNRADLHLHGGRTPWISDGTAHQWITPAGEVPPTVNGQPNPYHKGSSVSYVPDMWFDVAGTPIASCAGKTTCSEVGASNNPGPGAQTYYYTNAQSARMMFYHDHSWGITRLNVYAGEVAGYLVTDAVEQDLSTSVGGFPDALHTVPLIIQDKTFVDPDTIVDTDPTWIWGSTPGPGIYKGDWSSTAVPVKGDLWWPHVYVPAQNPYNPDMSGVNPFGRWHYGPWFWPPTDVGANGPTDNPFYNATSVDPEIAGDPELGLPGQPPAIPATPNPSWGAEAFMDTPVVNGTAYPTLYVDNTTYRFRILNGAHDRFWNLQLYVADNSDPDGIPDDCATCEPYTEVKMLPAVQATADLAGDDPDVWPVDQREGGVPDPTYRGPAMVQIMSEGGFLPKPVVLPNRPINWNVDPTTFTAGLVLQQNQGGGTLMLGPAERADVLVDFSQFDGKTLILYNDAPAPWPALDPHYDYYTGAPDNTEMGGAAGTLAGRSPNTRTIMRIVVGTPTPGSQSPGAVNDVNDALVSALNTEFTGLTGTFATGQEPIIAGQTAYNTVYERSFPFRWPTWGVSRITDTSLSYMRPDGVVVNNYPMEPKAIQDEMGETFDDFGRMSAKLGLENAFTNAGTQTFILQNFVDPPTEIVAKDQVQIWKITHNGVDTHPVHFHLFEVQLLNRVGWDGFIYLPDDNELGWKDTVRISPLEDTIVALRPAKVPVPFTVPNSVRPLNPAYPIGATGAAAGFSGFGVDENGQAIATTVTNEMYNFGHEYLWHCHILSHEEQDMMRPIVLNANSLLYTDNDADGFWQWSRGDWKQISPTDDVLLGYPTNPENIVASGTIAYGDFGAAGLWEWNGYNWRKISSSNIDKMVYSGSKLYVTVSGQSGVWEWNGGVWKKITASTISNMVLSGSILYVNITGNGMWEWNGSVWRKITASPLNNNTSPNMIASETKLYGDFAGLGLYEWNGVIWRKITSTTLAETSSMVVSGSKLYGSFSGLGMYEWDGSKWTKITANNPSNMVASDTILYGYFAGLGVYEWKGNGWVKITSNVPSSMAASGSVFYGNFPTAGGVYKREFGTWSLLSGAPGIPANIVAGF